MTRAALPLVAILLALSACKGERKDQGAGTAEGEVLPGSASDAMLPFDTVKSQAPLAPHTDTAKSGRAGKPAADTGDEAGDADTPAAETSPSAAPAPTASPSE